ncbi:hypothetical protein HZB05_00395 [Candidatus Wolfebacteria bacterium]|nr:hypothetical protein [Candidatus Wolfebacteria bacterium]
MDKKFLAFLEIAKSFNNHGVVPALYGSLGLYRLIGQLDDIDDVDIIIPDVYLKDKFIELLEIMKEAGYKQDPTHTHEFTKGEGYIGFQSGEELKQYAGIDYGNFKTTTINSVEFKELSPKDYLAIYKKTLDEWEKKAKKGYEVKIKALEKLLK